MRADSGYFLRLLLGIVLASTPLLGVHLYTVQDAFRTARDNAFQGVQVRGQAAALALERTFDKSEELMRFLAVQPEIQRHDWKGCDKMLQGVPQLDRVYGNAILLAPDGLPVCSSVANPGAPNYASTPAFKAALADRNELQGLVLRSRYSQRPVLALARAVEGPQGELIGVLALSLDLERLSGLLAADDLGPDESISVFQPDGTIIARTPAFPRWFGLQIPPESRELRIAQPEKTLVVGSLEGGDKAFYTKKLSRFGLYLSAGVPVDRVYAEPRRLAHQTAWGTLVALLLMMALAYYEALWLHRPLQAILQALQRRVPGHRGKVPDDLPGEFGEVAREYNKMVDERDASEALLIESERQAQRLRDYNMALSSINQLVVRRPEPDQLYAEICRVCVDSKHAHMGWVGLIEGTAVTPVSWGGRAREYTNLITPLRLTDEEAIDKPVLRAIRTGAPFVANDYEAFISTMPWKATAKQFGILSAVALPLTRQGQVVGAVSLYANEKDFFTPELMTLLIELVGDVSFGLDAKSREDDRIRRIEQEQEAQLNRQRAEAANQAKTQFIAQMSHELRTPLNAVLGFSQLLQSSAKGRLTEEEVNHLDYIFVAGGQLKALIDDVLDVSRLEAGTLSVEIQETPLAALVTDVIEMSLPLALKQGIGLSAYLGQHESLVLRTDPLRLRQVLLNLVSNGVKYNKPGGLVQISVEILAGTVELTVADTGLGMDQHQLARIFQPFNRLGREHTTIEGTGIGMSISRQLVELLGGRMSLDSTPGQGTVVHVSLPHIQSVEDAPALPLPMSGAQPPAPLPVEVTAIEAELEGSVLYIEDNIINAALVKQVMKKWPNVQLRIAPDGSQGLALLHEVKPDLVLLDMNLPGLSGLDVLRSIRQAPEFSALPVISLSASAMEDEVDDAMNAGATAYWTKPLDLLQFVERLRQLLSREAPPPSGK